MNDRASNECEASASCEFVPAEPFFAPLISGLQHLAEAYRVNTSEVDAELLELFVIQLRQIVSALEKSVPARDMSAIRQGAHSLQGMGGTIGTPEISVVGVEFSAAAQREDFARCAALLAATKEWMSQSGVLKT